MLEDRFSLVVQAACQLFGTRGYAATGMRDVARLAGLTPVQLYRLGLSKEDLLAEVSILLTDHQLRYITARTRRRPDETAADFIERYLLALYRSDIRNLRVRRETAAHGWLWSLRHEERIVAQVGRLLQPIEAAISGAGLDDAKARVFAVWALYYVGFRGAVVAGEGPRRCLDRIQPSLRLLLS